MRARSLLAGVLAGSALLIAPASSSASVDFGSSLIPPSAGAQSCPSSCTFWNTTINVQNEFVAPVSGVVVRFTLKKAAGTWTPLHLRIVEPVGMATGDTWRGLASSSPDVTPNSQAGSESFPARVPIQAGDYLAIEFDGVAVHHSAATGIFGAVERIINPKLPADGSQATVGSPVSGYELLLQGRIEPDADGDGFGDETQDGCPADPAKHSPCLGQKAKKCKKKKKKHKGAAAEAKKKKKCKRKKKRKK